MSNSRSIITPDFNSKKTVSANDIIKVNNNGGVDMDKYVTKELLDAKLETVTSNVNSKFDRINDKIDNFPLMLENELNKQDVKRREEQRKLIQWIVGTSIALASVIIAAIKLL